MAPNEDRVQKDQNVRDHYTALSEVYDRKANRACTRAYRRLVERWLSGADSVLEMGAGASDHVSFLPARVKVVCDASLAMLRARKPQGGVRAVVGDAQCLPFRDATFDAVFCINLLEHVPHSREVFDEAARVLIPGGRLLAITPNGNLRWLLDLLERLHLKLPEGPHRFLTYDDLSHACRPDFSVVEHRRFLAFPMGPDCIVRAADTLVAVSRGYGMFQYLIGEKRSHIAAQ